MFTTKKLDHPALNIVLPRGGNTEPLNQHLPLAKYSCIQQFAKPESGKTYNTARIILAQEMLGNPFTYIIHISPNGAYDETFVNSGLSKRKEYLAIDPNEGMWQEKLKAVLEKMKDMKLDYESVKEDYIEAITRFSNAHPKTDKTIEACNIFLNKLAEHIEYGNRNKICNKLNICVYIDDMAGKSEMTKKNSPLTEIISRRRHFNATIIINTQTYKSVGKDARYMQADLVLYPYLSGDELLEIYKEMRMSSLFKDFDNFIEIYNFCMDELKTNPKAHPFMMIFSKGRKVYKGMNQEVILEPQNP